MTGRAAPLAATLVLVAGAGVVTGAVPLDGDRTAPPAELLAGTDPLSADTDGDGLDDDVELNAGTNATLADTDGDGLEDGFELDGGTDPLSADTDGDGLDDGAELNAGTNATLVDTDGDGLDDDVELDGATDPLSADTDGDGLDDGAELNAGTNATLVDTDGDGLEDGFELDGATDPLSADTDGDGLDDGAELNVGTNATLADTDGDRLADGREVAGETAGGIALPGADPLRMDLYVQFNHTAGVEKPDAAFLDSVAEQWRAMPVENPDGSTGIVLHARSGGPINTSATYDTGNFWQLERATGADRLDGVYHRVLVVTFGPNASSNGIGVVSGRFSIVDAAEPERVRRNLVVHELLHNVLGELEAPGTCEFNHNHYCEGGWLESDVTAGRNEYLPAPLAAEIETDGFE